MIGLSVEGLSVDVTLRQHQPYWSSLFKLFTILLIKLFTSRTASKMDTGNHGNQWQFQFRHQMYLSGNHFRTKTEVIIFSLGVQPISGRGNLCRFWIGCFADVSQWWRVKLYHLWYLSFSAFSFEYFINALQKNNQQIMWIYVLLK